MERSLSNVQLANSENQPFDEPIIVLLRELLEDYVLDLKPRENRTLPPTIPTKLRFET
jgi:hypothetical protein